LLLMIIFSSLYDFFAPLLTCLPPDYFLRCYAMILLIIYAID